MSYAVVLTAGGLSTRLGMGIKKEFFILNSGKSVLSACAENFLRYFLSNPHYTLSNLVITLPLNALEEGRRSFFTGNTENLCTEIGLVPSFIEGGSTRQESVFNALSYINTSNTACTSVLIHDAARPYASVQLIDRVVCGTEKHGSCVPVVQSTDTQKRIDPATGFVIDHLDRKTIVCVQTPQGFSFPDILTAHQSAASGFKSYTDDSEIWHDFFSEKEYGKVLTCEGDNQNKKITFSSDLIT